MSSLTDSWISISDTYGLAPESRRVVPPRRYSSTGVGEVLSFPHQIEDECIFDFGKKITGRIWIEATGSFYYTYGSDLVQLAFVETQEGDDCLRHDIHDLYIGAHPRGHLAPTPNTLTLLEAELTALRYLKIRADSPLQIRRCFLEFSPPHQPLAGSFQCDDPELEWVWHMGAYTTLLCTQRNTDALVGVPAPGSGYVIWDGCRRDREVWAGDLRPSSLIWLAAYGDPDPVRNSLFMLWQARHIGCSESGLIPGSAASHQTFYEWTFWFLVNAWEYYQWTGDQDFLRAMLAPGGLHETLQWIERNANRHGIVEATNSWMWTLNISGELAAQAIAQCAGLEALAKLMQAGGQGQHAAHAKKLAKKTRQSIEQRFRDQERGCMRQYAVTNATPRRYPLDANAFAVLHGIGDAEWRSQCLRAMAEEPFQCEAGLKNYWPSFDSSSNDWFHNPATTWAHNEIVWPYVNAYAAWAYMEGGWLNEGLDLLKRFHRPLIRQDHHTIWEGMCLNGDSPIDTHGNLLSLCHAWGGTGTYLLHRYCLGVTPIENAFGRISCTPQLGPLRFATGRVPTPKGPISVEVEQSGGEVRGQLRLPGGVEVGPVSPGIEVVRV